MNDKSNAHDKYYQKHFFLLNQQHTEILVAIPCLFKIVFIPLTKLLIFGIWATTLLATTRSNFLYFDLILIAVSLSKKSLEFLFFSSRNLGSF